MRLRHFTTLTLIVVALCFGVVRPAASQTIGIASDHFTVDEPNDQEGAHARFLTFISYFDAMRAAHLNEDLDFIKAAGFDGIRIFANWWQFDEDLCSTAADDTLLNASGGVRGDGNASGDTPLGKFRAVLDAAKARGLIVDVSFTRETVPGLSVPGLKTGIVRVAELLGGSYPNVLFDLQNERDQALGADPRLTVAQVGEIAGALRAVPGWSSRVIVASNSSASNIAETIQMADAGHANLPAIAYHDTRDKDSNGQHIWHNQVATTIASLRAAGKPVYLQEPVPWNAGLNVCGEQEPNPKEADGDASHFKLAVARAKSAGAAAWTFHTRQSFRLSDGRFEDRINAVAGERALLIGTSSINQAADDTQWGLSNQLLTVSFDGTGAGSVAGPGLSCQSTASSACTSSIAYNTSVTLTAAAAAGSTLKSWTGDCDTSSISGDGTTGTCTIQLTDPRTVVATFDVIPTDTVLYYHTDAIESVRMITDKTGAVTERLDYLPFGEEWSASNQTSGELRKFAGKERDAETDFDYFGGRYLSSHTGRFTTVDPVVEWNASLIEPQRWNRYAYVLNNPLRRTDPDGRCPDLCVAETVIVIGAYKAAMITGVALGTAGILVYTWVKSPEVREAVTSAGAKATALVTTAVEGVADLASRVMAIEATPTTEPGAFEPVRGTDAKKHKDTGEIWQKDRLHKDHYEVYKNKRDFEKGVRDRDVWLDGNPKRSFR